MVANPRDLLHYRLSAAEGALRPAAGRDAAPSPSWWSTSSRARATSTSPGSWTSSRPSRPAASSTRPSSTWTRRCTARCSRRRGGPGCRVRLDLSVEWSGRRAAGALPLPARAPVRVHQGRARPRRRRLHRGRRGLRRRRRSRGGNHLTNRHLGVAFAVLFGARPAHHVHPRARPRGAARPLRPAGEVGRVPHLLRGARVLHRVLGRADAARGQADGPGRGRARARARRHVDRGDLAVGVPRRPGRARRSTSSS